MPDTATATRPAGMPENVAEAIRRIGPNFDGAARAEFLELYGALLAKRPAFDGRIGRHVGYGPDGSHRLDIHLPKAPARGLPVVAFFHGGGFVEGSKTILGDLIYGNIMRVFVEAGFIGVNATYRLAPDAPWPAGARDVALCAGWLRDNIARYGGDPERVILIGHSAGGTHVAAYAYHRALRDADPPACRAVVLLSATTDVEERVQPANIQAYYGADPSAYAAKSTVRNLADDGPACYVSIAALDPPRFATQAENFVAAMRERGAAPETNLVAGHNHLSEVYHIGTEDQSLAPRLIAFCRQATG
jgi:acetyl esterase/lipase